ncbi:MAG: ATP-grasp domain-containing protein [Verrucomicrobiota bacterium]|nr:ATP-grasp domain-containing protein [Verrucomicrobiota bacterium]
MITSPLRLLVTGVNSDFGQGFVKALRLSCAPMEIHGCDASEVGIGPTFVESFDTVPRSSAGKAYVDCLDRLCSKLGINAVLPASPPEIDALCRLSSPPVLPCGVPVVCLSAQYRDVFDDKLLCFRALEGQVELAPYADGADPEMVRQLVAQSGFPVIVKRRTGQGGLSFHVVKREEELALALSATPGPIVQGFIDEEGGEYSIGVFAADGIQTAIAFRRRLARTGSSWSAETVDDAEVLAYCEAIARASGLRGSANVQVRKSSKGVRLLEVNARFSSLAPARACAGFRDVEWSVALAIGRTPDIPRGGYRSIRLQRFVHEMIDDGSGFALIPEWTPGLRRPLAADSDASAPFENERFAKKF